MPSKIQSSGQDTTMRTSGKLGEGGFKILDVPGRGWFVKIRTSEKLKFQIFSELISYVISIYFDYKIEYFFREKP